MKQILSQILHRLFPDTNIQMKKEFKSKTNTVALISIDNTLQIVKYFNKSNQKGLEQEIHLLRIIPFSFQIPQMYMINRENNLVIMEYIKGQNLCDALHDMSISQEKKEQYIHSLATWFAKFHQITKKNDDVLIKGDAHIRNFIVSDDKIFGVDFEESQIGNPTEDIVECCVSILFTDPFCTDEKFIWCNDFIKTYNELVPWSLINLDSYFHKTIEKVITRRNNSNKLWNDYLKKRQKIKHIFLSYN
jgi:tRNA A-37 threonylcarbamoyl transferase component Bud32